MIRLIPALLMLGACQAMPPAGPASLQIVHPDFYSRSPKYHGGAGVQRGDVGQSRKSRDGTVSIISPAEAAPELPTSSDDEINMRLERIQNDIKKLRERLDWEQNSGAWRPAPGERLQK